MSDEKDEKSFWSTMPGILTGIAAVITAIGTLIIAIHGFGLPDSPDKFTPTATLSPTALATSSPTATAMSSPTALVTISPTATATSSPTALVTFSPTATATSSPTAAPANSPTATATYSPSPTPIITPVYTPISVIIPNTAAWFAEGPGAVGIENKDDLLGLRISLHGGPYNDNNGYAQECLDLTSTGRFAGFEKERNADGSYNLARTEVTGFVRTDQDFKGDPGSPNVVYFTLKNRAYEPFFGSMPQITDAIKSPAGMEVVFVVPDSTAYRDIGTICLSFAFSNKNYDGIIYAKNIKLNK